LIDPALRTPLAISLGAVPGALLRYYLSQFCLEWFGAGFPYGTLLVNLSGAFVMGFFATLPLERAIASPDLRSLIAVGFLGAYTTFSTYTLETSVLLQNGNWDRAFLYWSSSAFLGVASLELGCVLARQFR
jgi:fluoride exporter